MTVLCVLWATLSTVASILACSGFYLPYWIQGRLMGKADAYFSSFRRCNYPRIRTPNAPPEIVYECARYSSFWDIPSAWWQASTVTMGIGVAIAVIGALTLLAAASSFLPHILKTPRHSRILGSLQLLAAAMICGGLVMYPIGWDNREVRESCGKGANVYNLGEYLTFSVHRFPSPVEARRAANYRPRAEWCRGLNTGGMRRASYRFNLITN
ncbi:LHFPL tetraspan subfamily member 6 protein isoform X1 [Cardiocondyla obscurior]|uniref:LHFPL tetraspan subfamily member 6 protein isoform X1 n=1 Tax=Cardiocondyla obscurior TaxID=286306 RepID=UPI00396567BA